MRDEEHIQRKVWITSIDFDELISHWDRCKRECDDGDKEEIEELPIPVRMIEEEVAGGFSSYSVEVKDCIYIISFKNCVFLPGSIELDRSKLQKNCVRVYEIVLFDQFKLSFNNCTFTGTTHIKKEETSFKNCIFQDNVLCLASPQRDTFLFSECSFNKEIMIAPTGRVEVKLCDLFYKCNFSEPAQLKNLDFGRGSFVIGHSDGLIFSNCTFTDLSFEDFPQQTFQDGCVFEGDAVFKIKSQDEQIIISQNTAFKGNVTFSFLRSVAANIEMRNSHFERNVHFYFDGSEENIDAEFLNFGSLKILGCEFEKKLSLSIEKNIDAINQHIPIQNLTFKANKFSGPLIADHLKVTDFTLQYNQFSDVASFAHCCFHSIPEDGFAFNSFLSLVNFHQAELPKGFDLSDNLFKEGINFRGVTLTDDPKKHSLNQESCRIIKYSLDKIGNTVEANEYFALEMRNFSHSISLLKNRNKFVIWLSRMSSNFGQSWFRPFALLMLTASGYYLGAVLPDIANEYQQTSTLTLQPFCAHNFLEGILPLKKLMGLGSATYKIELTLANTLTTLIQTYLIWQIILASKRQIKR